MAVADGGGPLNPNISKKRHKQARREGVWAEIDKLVTGLREQGAGQPGLTFNPVAQIDNSRVADVWNAVSDPYGPGTWLLRNNPLRPMHNSDNTNTVMPFDEANTTSRRLNPYDKWLKQEMDATRQAQAKRQEELKAKRKKTLQDWGEEGR